MNSSDQIICWKHVLHLIKMLKVFFSTNSDHFEWIFNLGFKNNLLEVES